MDSKSGEHASEVITEQHLVQRVQEGDRDAENVLFEKFSPRIDLLVRNRLGYVNDDWQDVAIVVKAAVLLQIRAGRYEPNKARLYTWVYAIAENQIKKYFRGKKQPSVPLDELRETLLDNPGNAELERKELLNLIKQVLEGLDTKYRMVLQLKYFEGLKPKKIAKELNLSVKQIYEFSNYATKLVQRKCKERGILQDLHDSG